MRFQEAFDITTGLAAEEIHLRSSQEALAGVKDPLLAGLRVAYFFAGCSTSGLDTAKPPLGREWRLLERDAFSKIARGELPGEMNQLIRVGALLKLFPAAHGNAAILRALKTTLTYKRNLEHAARMTVLKRL